MGLNPSNSSNLEQLVLKGLSKFWVIVGLGESVRCVYSVFVCLSVCVCVCNQVLQASYLKTNLYIFAKFAADNPYKLCLPWKWLAFRADHIQDGWLNYSDYRPWPLLWADLSQCFSSSVCRWYQYHSPALHWCISCVVNNICCTAESCLMFLLTLRVYVVRAGT